MVTKSSVFREFVFTAYSRRITDLFALVDDIVFQRMDVRLATRLLELADPHDVVHATHAKLATELGTAREVICRILSEFHRREWIEQSRGEVRITNSNALRHLEKTLICKMSARNPHVRDGLVMMSPTHPQIICKKK